MRKQYKRKKGSGCALCKPHKHGWVKRWKAKDLVENAEAGHHESLSY